MPGKPSQELEELANWLRLTLIPGLGGESQRALLASFGMPSQILAASHSSIEGVVGSRAVRALREVDSDAREITVQNTLAWLAEPGNHVLTLADAAYPSALLEIPDPPCVLYAKGRIELLNRPMLAMVGSRNATAQGERDAQAFASHLAQSGLTIVSGLALGIDAAAHRGALESAAGTVAIIGTGADRLYPARNAELGRRIAEVGLIVSEFPLGTPALTANFPRRNRLIAGLALGTLVVEAAPRSGSLITARLATEMGREVFAIPGSIHSPQSRGCHQLIRQGAKLVETAQDILEELRWESPQSATQTRPNTADSPKVSAGDTAISPQNKDPQHEQVLTALGHAPSELESLSAKTGLTAQALLAILLGMELAGEVAQLPGGRYQRLHPPTNS
jgi:DNA processing protein